MSTTEELLRQAVVEKRPVSAVYDSFPRLLCPHALGWKDGELRVLCYQYGGRSAFGTVEAPTDPDDGPPKLWRCMIVGRLDDVRLLDPGPWYTCRERTQSQSCIDTVSAEVPRT
jgi:hypothetical protein